MEHNDEYEVIEIAKSDAEKFGVDVRPEAELIADKSGEENESIQ